MDWEQQIAEAEGELFKFLTQSILNALKHELTCTNKRDEGAQSPPNMRVRLRDKGRGWRFDTWGSRADLELHPEQQPIGAEDKRKGKRSDLRGRSA